MHPIEQTIPSISDGFNWCNEHQESTYHKRRRRSTSFVCFSARRDQCCSQFWRVGSTAGTHMPAHIAPPTYIAYVFLTIPAKYIFKKRPPWIVTKIKTIRPTNRCKKLIWKQEYNIRQVNCEPTFEEEDRKKNHVYRRWKSPDRWRGQKKERKTRPFDNFDLRDSEGYSSLRRVRRGWWWRELESQVDLDFV